MRTLALTLFFVAMPLASGSLSPVDESEHWAASGLDLNFAGSLINNQSCNQSADYLKSCISGLSAGYKFLGQRRLISNDDDFDKLLGEIALRAEGKVAEVLGQIINAQLQVFDKYAQIIPNELMSIYLNGESKDYFGFGLETSITGAGLSIFRVHPNSSAKHHGLRVGDQIIAVNGIESRDLETAKMLNSSLKSSRVGAAVLLTINRGGIRFTRVVQPSALVANEISQENIELNGRILHYLRLRQFGEGSCQAVQNILMKANSEAEKISGLILDLRHNPGGIVAEGQCLAQVFLGKRKVIERNLVQNILPVALGEFTPKLPEIPDLNLKESQFRMIPLVVLIDAASKSMAEVVAGSLQGYKRALIIGEASYGKSGTQIAHQLESNSKLRLIRTVSHFLIPSLIGHGPVVQPDISVPLMLGASGRSRVFQRESGPSFLIDSRSLNMTTSLCIEVAASMSRDKVGKQFGYQDEQMATALAAVICSNRET